MFRSILIYIFICIGFVSSAQSPDFLTEITRDSILVIDQPAALASRLKPVVNIETTEQSVIESESVEQSAQPPAKQNERTVGYRVQVFSDNNIRTAKAEARNKAAAVTAAMPHYRTYVTYESPFWRLRVGDLRSKADATEAADELKRTFPAFSREIRVVRDRVNL